MEGETTLTVLKDLYRKPKAKVPVFNDKLQKIVR